MESRRSRARVQSEAPSTHRVQDHLSGSQSPEQAKQQLDVKSGPWVIVAEDDIVLRSLLSETVREAGFQVLTAADGLEALKLYAENTDKVRLVVTDVLMPVMDGLNAAVEMRKIDDDVSFLLMSGLDSGQIEQIGIKIEDIPNSDFMKKPFEFSDMISRIKRLGANHSE